MSCTATDYYKTVYAESYTEVIATKEDFAHVAENKKCKYSLEELTFIGLINNEGAKLYMDKVSSATREKVFQKITGKESKYYQHKSSGWEKVPKGTKGGFWKGKVLSEADINFSTKISNVVDAYIVLEVLEKLSAVIIILIVGAEATPVVVGNIEAVIFYTKTFGVYQGFKMYSCLGASVAPHPILDMLKINLYNKPNREYKLLDVADEYIKLEDDAWGLTPIERGNYLDDVLGNNLGHNYPVVDNLENRVLTSFKSFDPSLKSYQGTSGMYNKIVRDATTLNKFTGARWGMTTSNPVIITTDDFNSKVLRIVLPNTTITAEQMLGLQAAKLYINKNYNIKLLITIATK